MELKITEFFNSVNAPELSGSVMELGTCAGQITWNNSLQASKECVILDNDAKREAFREFVKDSGGWNEEEIAAWTDEELNALCLQWIAGDMREGDLDNEPTEEDWAEYQEMCEAGQAAGRLFKGDDGEIYFCIGS